jgi:DNA-binding SARP family transcriptional activator/predicted ATPase
LANLALSLLGTFQVLLGGQPATGFKSNKVRALLAYLATEADKPHRREVLAGLLWGDMPDQDALSNLRYSLANLRQVIDDRYVKPSYLLINRDTLQFNIQSDAWLDVAHLLELMGDGKTVSTDVEKLEQAVDLYQGCFLEGFYVSNSPGFEDWMLLKREQLARKISATLHQMTTIYEQRGEYDKAQSSAWKLLALEPWDETAHQRLMRALALDGQRSTALMQYETCRRNLAEELGVEPSRETTKLYEQIRDGAIKGTQSGTVTTTEIREDVPSFLIDKKSPQVEIPVFVSREVELARLDTFLKSALTGESRVVFITGEAGSGKTSLVYEFSRRAQEVDENLIVAWGNCNAYTGIGDPYLPFREILGLLMGDIEARWEAGAITSTHARRLWNAAPKAVQALVDNGIDLIDTFVPRWSLLEQSMRCASDEINWVSRLNEIVERKPPTKLVTPNLQQIDLFEQYTRVLQAIALKTPLLLVVDDLQWADVGSTSMLFHLGRRLTGSRVLIVGAYRPEEVALGALEQNLYQDIDDNVSTVQIKRHPLERLINEFQRDFGDIIVDVDQTDGKGFTEAFLDSEPNHLGLAFREMLYQRTRGHSLFTIELLRGLQERGDLIYDENGFWIEAETLDWGTLPARVEAAIRERFNRLSPELYQMLSVASVEGEDFTAEVLARVLGMDEKKVVRHLSAELDRQHHLVRSISLVRLKSGRLSRYRFRSYLFQKYIYESLDEAERAYLHEDVGNALEGLYLDQADEIAVQLARHYQEARIAEKAVHYLHQAGKKALHMSAYQEAIDHFTKGLVALKGIPDSPERAQLELGLQISLGLAYMSKGTTSPEVIKALVRARQLCQPTEKISDLSHVLGELSLVYYVRAELKQACELAEEALRLAQQTNDPVFVSHGHWYLGVILFSQGEYTLALEHLEQMNSFYQIENNHQSFIGLRGMDSGLSALAYSACCLWCLGYPEQANHRSQQVLTMGRELGHSYSLADILCYAGCLFNSMRRDAEALKENADELIRLAIERDFFGWLTMGNCWMGEALALLEQIPAGIVQIREGISENRANGVFCYLPGSLRALAEALAKPGNIDEGLAVVDEGLTQVEESGEHHWEAELYRLKGELLLQKEEIVGGEICLQKALEVARYQQAKMWELRAAMSLGRLWGNYGKKIQAHQILSEVYNWFTEGFDTADLIEASALLKVLEYDNT